MSVYVGPAVHAHRQCGLPAAGSVLSLLNYKLGTAGKMRPFVRGNGWLVLRRRLGGRDPEAHETHGGPGREARQLREA